MKSNSNISMLPILLVILLISLMPLTASAGCGKWVIRDNTDYLEDPAFDAAVADSTGTSVKGAENNSQSATEGKTEEPKVSKPEPIDVSGKWNVLLNDSSKSRLNLILIQNGDRIMGTGTFDGTDSKVQLTATGSVIEDALSLEVKLKPEGSDSKIEKKYQLDMTMSDETLSGTYSAYSSGEAEEEGIATASKH
jgi:hypothetical protein